MTTIAELINAEPAPTRGIAITHPGWTNARFVLELADPSAGVDVEWYDITDYWRGYDLTRGADAYLGKFRASVATVDLWADDDRLAPWNTNTSGVFGTHVDLGPGLLMRAGLIRVSGGATVDWLPRFTCKVEEWGDSSYGQGRRRQHQVVARDTLTSLVGVPLPASDEENWADRVSFILTQAGWQYDSLIYGATQDTGVPVKELPAQAAATSAIVELDKALDPAGLIFYTDRRGRLIVRPRVNDTFHAAAFDDGAVGTPWVDTTEVNFYWYACAEPLEDLTAYAVDHNPSQPFGLDRNEHSVINHVRITAPGGTFDDDNPISIERYDRKTMQASWIAENDVVAAQLLAQLANATLQARPVHTRKGYNGFALAAEADFLTPSTILHRNTDTGPQVRVEGWVRGYQEQVRPWGCDIEHTLTFTVDIDATVEVVNVATLRPPVGLHLTGRTDTSASFAWTNPTQVVTPTHTQIRLLNPASLWLTVGYPITTAAWNSLAPATGYEFQVRYIREVGGVVTDFSPSRSLQFTTLEPTRPHVDIPPGGTDGTVTLPEPDAGCILEWELQQLTGPGTWTTIDDGTVSTFPWEIVYPIDTLDPGETYRFQSREVCGGTPGGWSESDPFLSSCVAPPGAGTPPYDEASLIAFLPGICPPDVITEVVSDTPGTHGPAFGGVDVTGALAISAASSGVVAYGTAAQLDYYGTATLGWRGLPGSSNAAELAAIAGMVLSFVDGTTGVFPKATVTTFLGESLSVTDATERDPDDEIEIFATYDGTTGELALIVDEESVGTDTADDPADRAHQGDHWRIGASEGGWIGDVGVWDEVLAIGAPPLTVTINQKAGQSDPATGTPILFEAVFSEAVTGFVGTDVTLTGTAGATVAAVSTLDNITFTVGVSGMTGSGTVIASIAAAVCTATATSAPNEASTSTDNTVTYSSTPDTANLIEWHNFGDLDLINASGTTLVNLQDPLFDDTWSPTNTINTGALTLNGHNVLQFGANAALAGPDNTHYKVLHNGTVPYWWLAVARVSPGNSSPGTAIALQGNNGGSTGSIGHLFHYGNSLGHTLTAFVCRGGGGTGALVVDHTSTTGSAPANVWQIWEIHVDASNATAANRSDILIDGADAGGSNIRTATPNTGNATFPLTIGTSGGSYGAATPKDIAYIVAGTDFAVLAAWRTYLETRFGL